MFQTPVCEDYSVQSQFGEPSSHMLWREAKNQNKTKKQKIKSVLEKWNGPYGRITGNHRT